MNFSPSALIAGFVFGVIGFYLFRNAKKNSSIPNIVIGIVLMTYPYLIQNDYLLWVLGFLLTLMAYRFRNY